MSDYCLGCGPESDPANCEHSDAGRARAIKEAGDAGYGEGVENAEARAIRRIDELEAKLQAMNDSALAYVMCKQECDSDSPDECAAHGRVARKESNDFENGLLKDALIGLKARVERQADNFERLLIYAMKYKDHSGSCSEWSGHEIQELCDQCREWDEMMELNG